MTPEEFFLLGLEQGTVIKFHWLDIYEDSVGDTRRAELGLRISLSIFWEVKDSHGVTCLVTTNTVDKDPSQQGWCCTPLALIPKIEVIKRPKKNAKKASPVPAVPKPAN
jgi:hypothetical protein